MKKYIAILSILALCACAKELVPQKEDISVGGETLTARIVNTKVNISDLGKFSWTEGDKIAIHRSVSGYETATLSVDGTFSVHLSDGESRDGYAIYPAVAADENASGPNDLAVVLPNAYSIPKAGMGDYTPLPMVAVNDPESDDVFFRHLGGVFRLEVADLPFETQKIALNFGKRITGSFPVEGLDTDSPFISLPDEQGEDIVFSLKSCTTTSDAIIINVPVPTGSYNVLSYKIYDRYDNLMGGNSIDIDKTVGRADGFEWTENIEIDLSRVPLCLRMAELGQITIRNNWRLTIEYSNDNMVWNSFDDLEKAFVLRKGDCLYLRGNNDAYSDSNFNFTLISSDKTCYVYGNIMSLITPDPDDFSQLKTLTKSKTFFQLFNKYDNKIYNHPSLDLLLPATTLAPYCYQRMFSYSCINRIELPATELAEGCYQEMFEGLRLTPEIESLPSLTMARSCYEEMFAGCPLTEAPELPATTLANSCYKGMFKGCKSLTSPPALYVSDLSDFCYSNMFENCTALESTPELPATTMKEYCYYYMFRGCSSIVDAPELPSVLLASCCYEGMFFDCTSLVNAPELPTEDFTIVAPGTTTPRDCYANMFSGCTSLVNAPELPATTLSGGCYRDMFKNCTSLVDAPELPAVSLASQCYSMMFSGCTSLVNAPELSATTLNNECYNKMFEGCISLVDAPELPATTVFDNSYNGMFSGCTSLVNAPDLPATILNNNCYDSMFSGCTSLVDAPELPATTLKTQCYVNMFSGCSSLNNVKALFTEAVEYSNISACVSGWLDGVAASGTFIGSAAATYDPADIGLPSGWTFTTE